MWASRNLTNPPCLSSQSPKHTCSHNLYLVPNHGSRCSKRFESCSTWSTHVFTCLFGWRDIHDAIFYVLLIHCMYQQRVTLYGCGPNLWWVIFLMLDLWCTLPLMIHPVIVGVYGWTIYLQLTVWGPRGFLTGEIAVSWLVLFGWVFNPRNVRFGVYNICVYILWYIMIYLHRRRHDSILTRACARWWRGWRQLG